MNSEITPESKSRLYEQNFRRAASVAILVSATYYLTSRIGFRFALQPGSVSLLWMPNSLLFAGLLLVPSRWWWLIILAVFPAHVASEWQSGVPIPMVLSWFLSNTIQALIGAVCLARLAKNGLRFDRTKDLTLFLICGVFLAPFVASFIDGALVKLNGWGHGAFWDIWRVRFLSNASRHSHPGSVGSHLGQRRNSGIEESAPDPLCGGNCPDGESICGWVLSLRRQTQLRSALAGSLDFSFHSLGHGEVRSYRGDKCAPDSHVSGYLRRHARRRTVREQYRRKTVRCRFSYFLSLFSIPLMVLAAVMAERRRAESAARDNGKRLTFALSAAEMDTWEWHAADSRWTWSEAARPHSK